MVAPERLDYCSAYIEVLGQNVDFGETGAVFIRELPPTITTKTAIVCKMNSDSINLDIVMLGSVKKAISLGS